MPPKGRARGYRRYGSPLGAHLRDDSCGHQAQLLFSHLTLLRGPVEPKIDTPVGSDLGSMPQAGSSTTTGIVREVFS
jgi:hypothetical protein